MKTSILITSAAMGHGNDQLGELLMKNFLLTLTETDEIPDHILVVNGGVFLVVEGSPVLKTLEVLEEKGVKVLACGTCLDFFQLKDKVLAGNITNMYTIRDLLNQSEKVITL